MGALILKLLRILALPVVVFALGGLLLFLPAHRDQVAKRLEAQAAPADRPPLNQRQCYDRAAVARHWGALDETTRADERLFLQLDLAFPFLYAGAIAASLFLAWALAGKPVPVAWVLVPPVLMALADWTENLVQLAQLARFGDGSRGESALQAGWIEVASWATLVKLEAIFGSLLLLLGLAVATVVRARRVRLTASS